MKQVNDFRSNTTLADIIKKSSTLLHLDKELKKHLPLELQSHCRVANYKTGCLIIAVDSAVWATQLRYMQSELITLLRQKNNLYQLGSIKLYVQQQESIEKIDKPQFAISRNAAEHLKACAETVESEELKESLTNLAERHQST